MREPVTGAARVANVGRQLAQLPWFARNLAIKVLIVAKLPKARACWATRARTGRTDGTGPPQPGMRGRPSVGGGLDVGLAGGRVVGHAGARHRREERRPPR